MSDKQIKPENLPVDLGGGEIRFVGRNDYSKRTAQVYAIKLETKITKDHVTQMLAQLDKGNREMPEGTPAEVETLFQAVIADYDAGIEKISTDAAEKQQKEQEAEQQAKAKQAKEDQLLVTVGQQSSNLAALTDLFDTGHMDRFIPKGNITDEQLLAAVKASISMEGFTDWMQGDLVLEAEKRGLDNVVTRLSESMGQKYPALYRKARTSKAFPPDHRREGVSFSIYAEMATAKFDEEQKKKLPALIKDVQEGKHNTQTIRQAVQEIKGTAVASGLPEESETLTFIVVPKELLPPSGKGVFVVKGFPKDKTDELFIFNPSTKAQYFPSNKPENRWKAIATLEVEPEKKEESKPKAKAKKK